MDIKKKSWIEEKRKNWPDRSLEKALAIDYPGCKTAFEAVKKVLSEKDPHQIKSVAPIPRTIIPTKSDYEVMKQVVLEVEVLLKEADYSKIPAREQDRISKMPITNAAEAIDWKLAWFKVLGVRDGEANS